MKWTSNTPIKNKYQKPFYKQIYRVVERKPPFLQEDK